MPTTVIRIIGELDLYMALQDTLLPVLERASLTNESFMASLSDTKPWLSSHLMSYVAADWLVYLGNKSR